MAAGGFAALKAATIGMAVLIVVGVAVVVTTIVRRAAAPPAVMPAVTAAVSLHEPAGTRIVGSSASGDRVVVQLSSGGPDRIAVLDARDGRVLLRVGLAP